MRILSFHKQFKGKLVEKIKYSTIRDHKKPHKEGDIVQIYCPSPRSGKGEKLFDAEIYKVLKPTLFMKTCSAGNWIELYYGILKQTNEVCELIAYIEGFDRFVAYPGEFSFEGFFFDHLELNKPKEFTQYLFREALEDGKK